MLLIISMLSLSPCRRDTALVMMSIHFHMMVVGNYIGMKLGVGHIFIHSGNQVSLTFDLRVSTIRKGSPFTLRLCSFSTDMQLHY